MRCIEQDHPCPWRYLLSHRLPVDPVIREAQVDPHRDRTVDDDIGNVTVVGRLEDDHLAARLENGGKRGIDRIGSPGSDRDLGIGTYGRTIETGDLRGEHLPQGRQPVHMRILIMPLAHGLVDKRHQLLAHREVREALAEVHRTEFRGKRRHDRENSRSYLGKFADKGGRTHGGLFDTNVFRSDKGLAMDPQVDLRYRDHVLLAIGHDPWQITLDPVDRAHLAAVDIILGGWYAKRMGKQVEGNKVLVFSEFPELHRIYMRDLPGFFPGKIEHRGDLHSMDDHPAAEIGEIEVLAIMGAEVFLAFRSPFVQQHVELLQKLFFVVTVKGFEGKLPVGGRSGQHAATDTDHLSKLRVDSGPAI